MVGLKFWGNKKSLSPGSNSTKAEKQSNPYPTNTHKTFKGFLPQNNKIPDVDKAQGERKINKLLTPKAVKDKFSLLQFLESRYNDNLEKGNDVVINISKKYSSESDKSKEMPNAPKHKTLLGRVIFSLSVPLTLVTKSCFSKMNDVLDKRDNRKKIARYIYSSLLYKTLKNIDTTNVDAKFWPNLAKAIDKGIKNVSKKDINTITTTTAEQNFIKNNEIKNIDKKKLDQILIDITDKKLKDIIKILPKKQKDNSLYNQFFNKKGCLKEELKNNISETVKEVVVYTDSLGEMYHDDLKKEYGLDF